MKVLEVYGDGDYSAVSYEDAISSGEVNALELWSKAKMVGSSLEYENEDTGTYFEYEAHEFGEVDPAFVSFVLSEICDYDYLKHHGMYVVEG